MYFRENDKIIEGYDGSDSCSKTPIWLIIMLVLILLIAIFFTCRSILKKRK
jgi:preprotein translocase subunit YajC